MTKMRRVAARNLSTAGKGRIKHIRSYVCIKEAKTCGTDGKPPEQSLKPVKDAYKADHSVKLFEASCANERSMANSRRAQRNVCGDRIENVGDADEAYEGMNP